MEAQREQDATLLRRHEPIIRFTEGELFLPAPVEEYVGHCGLWRHGPDGRSQRVAAPGELDLEHLSAEGRDHVGPGLWLRLVDHPFGWRQVLTWRHRPDRPRFRAGSRLAQVGVLSRTIDAANRLALTFRGKVAAGAQAAAETSYREGRTTGHPYYGRVIRQGGYVVLQYWFFYFFNDWRSRVYGVNDHEGDWEQVTIFLVEEPGRDPCPMWVAYSAHDEIGDDLRRRWDDPDLARLGGHPVVYAGLGSHSGAFLPGDYLVTFDPPALRGLVRLTRRVSSLLLPWTRDAPQQGVGIPYVDYHRGDGVAIGPQQPLEWTPVQVDDSTPWVRDYQGLWGDDTKDPFGGERGPAGPRYERSAVVRDSWGDPVGWAGLDKVSPTEAAAKAAVRTRLDQLVEELGVLDTTVEEERTRMRAAVAGGDHVSRASESSLVGESRRRVALRDDETRLRRFLEQSAPTHGPHDHLHHRPLPLETASAGRQRFLALWAALSTPLVLITLAVLVLPIGPSAAAITAAGLFALFAIESFARGHLVRFAITLVGALIALSVAVTVIVGLIESWRITLGALLLAGAAVFLAINVAELRRS